MTALLDHPAPTFTATTRPAAAHRRPPAGAVADGDLLDADRGPALDRYVDRLSDLKASPAAARRLMTLTRDPHYDMREVVRCLECDPVLTARVLRAVNSARYGLRHRVTGVRRAAAYLGSRSLRLLALSFSLADRFDGSAPLRTGTWQRALLAAAAAAELTRRTDAPAADEAYTAALLSDVGVLVLGGFDGPQYLDAVDGTPHGTDWIPTERRLFGTDHAELGGRFLNRWGLPEDLTTAAAGHHADPREARRELDVTVRVADRFAEAVLDPTADRIAAADELVRDHFPSLETGSVLGGVLFAAHEDADLYDVPPPAADAVREAWRGTLGVTAVPACLPRMGA